MEERGGLGTPRHLASLIGYWVQYGGPGTRRAVFEVGPPFWPPLFARLPASFHSDPPVPAPRSRRGEEDRTAVCC